MMAGRSSRWSDAEPIPSSFFEPRSIVVIGASTHQEKVGYAVLSNIIKSGYSGRLLAVNPRAEEVQGVPCFPDVRSLPESPDLAVVIIPAPSVPETITQCAERGIGAGVIISAGFRETGIEGRSLEREVVGRARDGGMRIMGPNCLGIMNTALPLNASFARMMPPGGSIGIISQSGAICTSLIDWAYDTGVGFSKLASLGNAADVVESEVIDALAADEQTGVIAMYLEGVSDGERFFESLRGASARKPVVFLKAGTTQAGARAASSHTGALAGSESAYGAVCEQAPALRAGSLEELVNLAGALATQPVPTGRRVAVVTNAGGPGIIASDACERAGLTLATICGDTLRRLEEHLPESASLHNPVDILGDAEAPRYSIAIETLLDDPDVDAVLVILTPQAMTQIYSTADVIVRIACCSEKTVLCSFMGAGSVESPVDRLEAAGIPNIPFPDAAMHVLGRMQERYMQTVRPASEPRSFDVDRGSVEVLLSRYLERGEMQLGAEDCRVLLGAYGIPAARFRTAQDLQEAKCYAAEMGYPVALKVISPQVVHKTDVGGVELHIEDEAALREAYESVLAGVHRAVPDAEVLGVGVQQMAPPGRELIIGVFRDPQFGPLVMVGLGGIYVETFEDVSFRLVPLTSYDATRMLHELKAFRLLEGVRGEPSADIAAVEDVLGRVSQLAEEHRAISEMDINPLMVYNSGDGCTCVDVRITLGG